MSTKPQDILEVEKRSVSLEEPTLVETVAIIDPMAERRLVRKLDLMLLPLFTLIYMCNFIDRTAIGNARVAGLEKDLEMTGYDFNKALTIFYMFYTAADIPSNLILKKYGPMWLAVLVLAFGIVSLASAFMTSYAGLIATRVFLGLAEGGTLSGLVYTLSQFYRRRELVLRIGIFFGLAPSLAGAFGGLLASGLLRLPEMGSVVTWRKILLVEGILTSVVGIILLFTMPEEPSKSKFLSEAERALAISRLDIDRITTGREAKKEKTTWKLVLKSFNVHTVVCTILFVILNVSFQGLSIFLPTIIKTLGDFSTIEVQLRTVPPYLISAVWAIATGIASFKYQNRFFAVFSAVFLLVVGYVITIVTTNPHIRYGACFLMISGGATGGPMVLTWGTENAAPDTMRAVASAAIPGIGALGAIISVWTYVPNDAPHYIRGNTANLVGSSVACVLTILLVFYLRKENRARDEGKRDWVIEGKTEEEKAWMGCRHPKFRYQL